MRSVVAGFCLAAVLAGVSAAPQTLASLISNNPNLTTFNELLTATGLTTLLASQSGLTVFAPSNAAITKLAPYIVSYFTDAKHAAQLTGLLKYHISNEVVNTTNVYPNQKITTLQGSNLFIEYIQNTMTLGLVSSTCDKDVKFVGAEQVATNGLLQVIDTVVLPPALICPDELFWVEQRGESRIGFDGYDCRAKGSTTLHTNEEKPVGIAIDSNVKVVFWSNDQNAKPFDSWLSKISYNATGYSQFVQGVYDPQGMDTDTVNQKLYFTEHQGNDVKRCNYDGSAIEQIWTGRTTVDFPADVAVDAAAGLVFITVQSVPTLLNGTLQVQNLDGSNLQVVAAGLIQNYGLCIDRYAQHVYYIQGGNGGSISCYAYGSKKCNTPTGANGVILDQLQYPYMCDVDNVYAPYGGPTKIVFSEPNVPGSIYSVNNDGTNVVLIGSDLDAPMGIKLGCRIFTA